MAPIRGRMQEGRPLRHSVGQNKCAGRLEIGHHLEALQSANVGRATAVIRTVLAMAGLARGRRRFVAIRHGAAGSARCYSMVLAQGRRGRERRRQRDSQP